MARGHRRSTIALGGTTNKESERQYYVRREASERHLGETVGDPAVARIHAELADRYASVLQAQQRSQS